MHSNKGVNLSLDTRIKVVANPHEVVFEAAQRWDAQLRANKTIHYGSPQEWTPEPVRHADVLPDSPPASFVEALGAASCTFIAEVENIDGEPKQLLIEPHTTAYGINLALGYEN